MDFDSSKIRYKPGESVPKAGIYRVLHHEHRPPHEVVLDSKDKFPECHQCGGRVRFELVAPAGKIASEAALGDV